MSDRFARLGALMARRRKLVVVLWLVFTALAGVFAPHAHESLRGGGFDVPGSQSSGVYDTLDAEFHASTLTTAVVVYSSNRMTVTDPAFARAASAADDRLRHVDGVTSVRSYFGTKDPSLASRDRHTALALVAVSGGDSAAQNKVGEIRDQLKDLDGVKAEVTGFPAVQYDTYKLSEEDLLRTEAVTVPIVTIFLLVFFGSVIAAAVPLALGLATVVISTSMLGLIGDHVPTSIFALNIGSLIGLGLAIDFSLIMVRRYREERAAGREVPDAVAATMSTAGRSIVFSGIMLLGSMVAFTMVFHDLMIVRSISLGVVLVSAIGLLAGVTLLPALLAILGDRVDMWRVLPRRKPRPPATGVWYRLSASIMKRPVQWLVASLLVLGILASPLLHIDLVGSSTGTLPPSTESAQGAKAAEQAFGANALTPISVVIRTRKAGGAFTPEFLGALRETTSTLAADPRTARVESLSTLLAQLPDDRFTRLTSADFGATPPRALVPRAAALQFVNLDGAADTAVLTVLPKSDMYAKDHQQLVADLREAILPHVPGLQGYTATVGGDSAAFVDFKSTLYGRFPPMAATVAVLILLLLLLFFRSVVLPLKAVVMSLLPLVATYGVVVWLFQDGHGETALDFQSQGRLSVVTPVIIFVILFGISSDYEVFMLSRVRENFDRTGDTVRAVSLGLQQTAGLITAAALILIATFGSLAASSVETLKEIGVGLAVGVLLDATVVRLVMVPATMQLMRTANWWLPGWLERRLPTLNHDGPPAIELDSEPETVTAGSPS